MPVPNAPPGGTLPVSHGMLHIHVATAQSLGVIMQWCTHTSLPARGSMSALHREGVHEAITIGCEEQLAHLQSLIGVAALAAGVECLIARLQ